MKKHYILLFISLFILTGTIYAQPVNDDCNGAIQLTDVSNFCNDYISTGATYDVVNGTCVNPTNLPNVWFKFIAEGSDVRITTKVPPTLDAFISLGEYNGGDCQSANWSGIACDVNILTYSGLTIGEEYFVIVSFDTTNVTTMQFCIDNPQNNPPPNDDPCNPVVMIPDGSCQSGTTVDATPDWLGPCGADSLYDQTVFYQTTISTGNNTLTADLSGVPEGVVLILDFGGDCNSTPTILAQDCGQTPLSAVATVTEGNTYWIMVSTTESGEGTFQLCLTESGPPPGCAESDLCSAAENLGTIVANNPPTCVDACNIGGTPDGVSYGSCLPGNWVTTFYSFTSDANSVRATIDINSNDPNIDLISVVLMTSCNSGTYIDCSQGVGGSTSLDGLIIQPNTQYIIVVGTPPGATGEFDVCVQTFNLPDEFCIGRNNQADTAYMYLEITSTSMGSPLGGPYQPGEEVSFHFHIKNYSSTNTVQWLQGIVPVFGPGWDPSSFTGLGKPVTSSGPNSAGGASWSWYGENEIDYDGTTIYYSLYNDTLNRLCLCYYTDPDCPNTGIDAGDWLPAGWYAYNPGGSGCANDGDPDNGWGDGKTGPWDVNFTLKVREFTGPESCTSTGLVDCWVKMFTFGDQQTGCWNGSSSENACAGDEYKAAGGINKCCEGPIVDPLEATICSGEQLTLQLTSDFDPDVTYNWTVDAPPSVTGASDGSGLFISQVLINTSNSPQVVIYHVTGTYIPNACLGEPTDITVTVLPEIMADAGEPVEGCAQVDFTLGGSPTASGGSGQYTYQWNNGADNVANPTVQVNSTTTFIVTVTDSEGCTTTDEVTIEVKPAVLTIITGNTTYCEEDEFTILDVDPISGELPYQSYAWEGPGGSQFNGEQISVTDEGTYVVTVTDANGCTGTNSVNINVIQTPEIILTTIPSGVDSICPGGQVTIAATIITDPDENFPSYTLSWKTPTGPVGDKPSVTATEPGDYILTVIDALGCMARDTLTLAQADVPDPVIIGDTIICHGGNTTLALEHSYTTYLWSNNATTSSIIVNSAGLYNVTVTSSSGCMGEAAKNIIVDNSASANAGPDREITCDSTTIHLDGSGSSSGNNFDYYWSTTDGNIVSDPSNIQIEVDAMGTYTLTVTNTISGCIVIDDVVVNLNTTPPSADAGPDKVLTCNSPQVSIGSNNNPTGAQYTILWTTTNGNISGDTTTPFIDVDAQGDYTITVKNTSNGCVSTDVVTVTKDQDLPAAVAGVDYTLNCNTPEYTPNTSGSSTGTDFQYSWSGPNGGINSGGNSLSPVLDAEGTYILTVNNTVSGCTTTDTLVLTSDIENPLLSGSQSYTINCYHPDTTLYVTIGNYNGTYTYTWTTTNGNIVSGQNDSLAVIDKAGTYTVVVTNADNHCSASFAISVTDNFTVPIADAGATQEFDCATTTLTLDGSGSGQGTQYSYEWSGNPGNIINGKNTLSPEIDEPGTYTILVTNNNNGCSSTDQVIITKSDDIPQADGGGDREITCDSSTIRLFGTASGGNNLSYQWTASNGGNIVSGATTLTPIVNAPGTYELEVINNDNNCSVTSTIEVIDATDPPSIASPKTYTLTCADPEVTLDASVGTFTGPDAIYQWKTSQGDIIGTILTVKVDEPGTYTFFVENDATGCKDSVDFTVNVAQSYPVAEIIGEDTLTCARSTITLDASNSSSGGSFVGMWSAINGGVINGDPTQYSMDVTEPGTYIFEVTNTANGCIDTDTIEVFESKNEPSIQSIDDVVITCANTQDTISSIVQTIGNASYTWSSTTGNIVGATDQAEVTVNGEGVLTLVVTDNANSCSSSITVNITEDKETPLIDAGIDKTLTCNQNSVTLDGSGSATGSNYTYLWSSPDGGNISGGATTLTPVVDVAASYILTVTNTANGCTASDTVVVSIDENLPQIVFEQIDSITCKSETVTIDASNSSQGNNFTFDWTTSDGVIASENGLIITVSEPGTYTLTITDIKNNCQADASVTVIENKTYPYIEIETPDKFVCLTTFLTIDASASVNGNNYIIEWTTTDGIILSGQNALVLEVGSPGRYVLRITDKRNGCSNSQTVEVYASDDTPVADAGPDLIITCADTIVTADASGSSLGTDFEALWTTQDGSIFSGETTLSPVFNQGGTYILTITNTFNHCVSMDTLHVEVNQEYPLLGLAVSNELNCNFTEATIKASIDNAVQYSIEWFYEGQLLSSESEEELIVENEGKYTIAVSNLLNECYSTESIDVIRDTNIIKDIAISAIDPSCSGDNTGCLVIENITGGEKPFTIFIDGEKKTYTPQLCGLSIGVHDFRIVGNNGCEIKSEVTIKSPNQYSVSIGDSYEIEPGDSITIGYISNIPQENIETIIWKLAGTELCTDCDSLSVQPKNTTRVIITIIDINGCVFSDFANILVRKQIHIYVPNAFSPNGDKINDILTVYGGKRVEKVLSFRIFDRWGEQMFLREEFEPNDLSQGWNGTFQGEKLNPAVFVYKVRVLMEDGTIVPVNGTVLLLK